MKFNIFESGGSSEKEAWRDNSNLERETFHADETLFSEMTDKEKNRVWERLVRRGYMPRTIPTNEIGWEGCRYANLPIGGMVRDTFGIRENTDPMMVFRSGSMTLWESGYPRVTPSDFRGMVHETSGVSMDLEKEVEAAGEADNLNLPPEVGALLTEYELDDSEYRQGVGAEALTQTRPLKLKKSSSAT